MKLFFIKASIFVALSLTIFILVSLAYRVDLSNTYMSIIVDKHNRLDSFTENRLIMVGGSNLPFGLNSQTIQEQLGVNAVNMGLNAGLGRRFMINEIMPSVRKGDIVLLILEYELWDPTHTANDALVERVQYFYPNAKDYYSFSWSERLNLTYAHFKKVCAFPIPPSETVYSYSAFDQYCEIAVDRQPTSNPQRITGNIPSIESLGDASIVKKLSDQCVAVGAQLVISFPSYPKRVYESNIKQITALDAAIRRELPFIKVIGTPETFLVDDSRLFDTPYHLTTQGAKERTDVLITLLKNSIFAVPNQTK